MDNISIKELSDEELIDIMNDDEASYKDVILASVEKGERDYKRGNFYTSEEVKKRILERSSISELTCNIDEKASDNKQNIKELFEGYKGNYKPIEIDWGD